MPDDPAPVDPTNPNVTPAKPWEWSAFLSMLLVGLEFVAEQLGAMNDPPRWVAVALAAIPWVTRLVRLFVTKTAVSFRRA